MSAHYQQAMQGLAARRYWWVRFGGPPQRAQA
jgi:hypothetical protein